MLKRRGFTILEVLTTITIMAIVASIAAPEYWRWRDRDEFRAQGQVLFDNILLARNSAMTNKFCNDGNNAVRWGVFLDTNVEPMLHQVRCYTDDTTFVEETAQASMLDSELNFIDFNEGNPPALFDGSITNDFPDNLMVSFFTGGVNARIEYERSGLQRAESFDMVIDHDDSDFQHTICMNRIAGFPTFNKNGNTCQEF